MNNGEISLEQQQGESEQDYLKRLADVALIEEDPTRAFLYNTNQFKKNLKTLIKSEWKIENLVKSFSNDDQFLLNKTFAGFKKHFNNLYGPGNKDLEVEEYVNIIREYIDSEATSLVKKAGTRGEKEGEEKGEPSRLLKRYVKSSYDDEEKSKADEPAREIEEETKANEPDEVFVDLFDESSASAPAPAPAPATAPAPAPAPATAPPVDASSVIYGEVILPKQYKYLEISKRGKILEFKNNYNQNYIYFKIGPKADGNKIYYSYNNDKLGLGNEIDPNKDIENYGYIRKHNGVLPDLRRLLRDARFNIWDKDVELLKDRIIEISGNKTLVPSSFITFFDSFTSGSGLTGKLGKSKKSKTTGKPTGKALQGLKKPEKPQKPKKQLVVQKGASIKEVPYRCEFGKSVILLNKLYYNNILSVKDSKGINIQGIPNSKVDDKFVNIIMKICNNEDFNNKDILDLTDKDAILFSVLMNKSGLKKKYNIDNTKSIKALKDRLALVEGQMLAGNTNDEIKTELYDIVFKLAQLGATSLSVARKYFKDTEKLMF